MMGAAAIERCERETITIRTTGNPKTKPAWRFGHWAVHEGIGNCEGGWVITHLPTGFNTASGYGWFKDAASACEAMVEIDRLRNSWVVLDQDDLPDLKEPIVEISQRHGGRKPPRPGAVAKLDGQMVNGYSAEAH